MVDFSQFTADVEALWTEVGIASRYLGAIRGVLTSISLDEDAAQSDSPSRLLLPGLCCEAAGGNRRQARWVTTAWALLYLAAHLLDNAADDRLETEPLVSRGVSINVANGLMMGASLALSGLEAAGVKAKTARIVRDDFYRAGLEVCAGQHDDLTTVEPTLEQCWQIAKAKSGAFFALACKAGAQLATDDVARIDFLRVFGHCLGVLIQIADDVKDLWAAEGKCSDLSAGRRWTLPIAYAMSVTSGSERERLRACLRGAATDANAEAKAHGQIVESGALLYLAVEAERRRERARVALETGLQFTQAREQLLALLDKTVFHDHWLALADAVAV